MGLFRVFLLQSYKWDWDWDWVGDLCVGLLYEHRFAVLIIETLKNNNGYTYTTYMRGQRVMVKHHACIPGQSRA